MASKTKRVLKIGCLIVAIPIGFVLMFVGVFVGYACFIFDPAAHTEPHITPSYETTRITEPLRPDGYVDFAAALNAELSRGVTPENNAAVLLVRAMGPKPEDHVLHDHFFQMLGIEPLPKTGAYLTPCPERETDNGREVNLKWQTGTRPWRENEFPAIAKWLHANEANLALTVEASKRPKCYLPLVSREGESSVNACLCPFFGCRSAAWGLMMRGMLQLGNNRVEEASADFLACHRLARQISQTPIAVASLIAHVMERNACRGDMKILSNASTPAKQILRLQKELKSLSPLRPAVDSINLGERYALNDWLRVFAQESPRAMLRLQGPAEGVKEVLTVWDRTSWALRDLLIDWNRVAAIGNHRCDRLVAIMRMPFGEEKDAALAVFAEDSIKDLAIASDINPLARQYFVTCVMTERLGMIIFGMAMSSLEGTSDQEATTIMHQMVIQTGFALAAYREDHGSFPAELDQLVPKYLEEVPNDIFAGNKSPLRYQIDHGGYLLYSIGPNRHDEDGKNRDDDSTDDPWNTCDDIALRVPMPKK